MDQREVLKKGRLFRGQNSRQFSSGQSPPLRLVVREMRPKKFSDIDVAVIVPEWTGEFMKAQSELFRVASEVDLRIEPILLERKNDKSGFLDESGAHWDSGNNGDRFIDWQGFPSSGGLTPMNPS